jgi:hypothetical protein
MTTLHTSVGTLLPTPGLFVGATPPRLLAYPTNPCLSMPSRKSRFHGKRSKGYYA